MDTEKMRQEFEAWYRARHDGFMPSMYGNEYDWGDAQACWESWQASRAALVIELPQCDPDEAVQFGTVIEECRAAIEAAGLTVREKP